jgi:hypothetical protein
MHSSDPGPGTCGVHGIRRDGQSPGAHVPAVNGGDVRWRRAVPPGPGAPASPHPSLRRRSTLWCRRFSVVVPFGAKTAEPVAL